MYFYRAYGLTLRSEFPLLDITPADSNATPDVSITAAALPIPDAPLADGFRAAASLQEAHLHWDRVGIFRIRNGCEIAVHPVDGQEPSLIGSFVLGVCMGVLLHQRGLLVLHASAVQMGAGAVAFIGPKGWGKSTTAAALHGQGYPVMTDDVLAVEGAETPAPQARPGITAVKLWPSSLAALGEDPEHLPRVHSSADKRFKMLPAAVTAPLPLRRIYVLGAGPELAAERLPVSQAFLELLQHSYAPRFVGTSGTPPLHFHQCKALAESTPVFRLRRRADPDMLPEVLALLESHMQS